MGTCSLTRRSSRRFMKSHERGLTQALADMNCEQLFVHTVHDLANRVEGDETEYSLLMAAGLLRKLLMDAEPLIHAVNKTYRQRIRFEIKAVGPDLPRPPDEMFYLWALDIDPHASGSWIPHPVSQEKFLKWPVIHIGHRRATVHNVIDEACHVLGAVHAGTDKDLSYSLRSWDGSLKLNGHRPNIGLLKGIGSVTVRACTPLVSAIEGNNVC